MTVSTRRLEDLFTAAAIGLLLLSSMLQGTVVVGIALGLVIFGLVIFPKTRRTGIAVALAAAVVAGALAFIAR
jgi:hypothetical protein